jgi:hypothetical protein
MIAQEAGSSWVHPPLLSSRPTLLGMEPHTSPLKRGAPGKPWILAKCNTPLTLVRFEAFTQVMVAATDRPVVAPMPAGS